VPERQFTSLEGQSDVIPNLLLAIEQSDLGQMERLLASNFIFDFSQEAVEWRIVSTRSWGRTEELQALSNMFAEPPAPSGPMPVSTLVSPTWGSVKEDFLNSVPSWPGYIRELKMRFYEPDGNDWTALEGTARYYKDVEYTFFMKISADDFPRDYGGYSMRLVIGQIELDGQMIWQLVEWYDNYKEAPSN